MNLINKILHKLGLLKYDFDKSNPLGGGGERVDIQQSDTLNYNDLDLYQKNHYKRYEYAKQYITAGSDVGDFACGTGYGSVLLATKASSVIGVDLDKDVIQAITERYKHLTNVRFVHRNLLECQFKQQFNTIVSFETLEHLKEGDIQIALNLYHKWLLPHGTIIFSTPYMQVNNTNAEKLGFHLTFGINENKIKGWLDKAGFEIIHLYYQNYDTHLIVDRLQKKDFIICVAKKVA